MSRDVGVARRRRLRVGRRAGIPLLAALLLLHGAFVDGGWAGSEPASPIAAGTPVAAGPLVVDGDPISALVPANPAAPAIFAVGGRGLYRSDDGGATWRRAGPSPPSGRIVAAVDSPLVLLAGSHPGCLRAEGDQVPLSRSDDGGATWQAVEGVTDVRPLAIWTRSNLALGESCEGLWLSTDAGLTWQTAPLPDASYDVSAFALLEGTDAAAPMGLIAGTSEGGTSRLWRLDLSDPANPAAGDTLVGYWGAGALAGRDRLYVIGTATGVLVSADAGASWRQSRLGLEEVTVSVDPFREVIPEEERRRGYGIGAVAISPDQPEHLYVGTVAGLYASFDGGRTWHQVGNVEGVVAALVFAPSTGRLLVETDAGVVALPLTV